MTKLVGKDIRIQKIFFRRKVKNGTRRIDYTSRWKTGISSFGKAAGALDRKSTNGSLSGVRSVSIQNQILSPLKDTKEIPIQSKFRTLVSVPEKVNV